jgi:hypothetical protein
MSYEPSPLNLPTAEIPSRCGHAVYRRSNYNGTWWKIWKTDRPNILIGTNPPKNP